MPLEEPHIIWTITAMGMGILLILLAVLIPFLIVMHNILYRRLDPILFKEPWFNPQQLVMFNAWPLSFFKTINYLFLLTYPNYARKRNKKFKDLKDIPHVEPSILLASKIYILLHISVMIIGIAWLIFIFSVFAIDTWFS